AVGGDVAKDLQHAHAFEAEDGPGRDLAAAENAAANRHVRRLADGNLAGVEIAAADQIPTQNERPHRPLKVDRSSVRVAAADDAAAHRDLRDVARNIDR